MCSFATMTSPLSHFVAITRITAVVAVIFVVVVVCLSFCKVRQLIQSLCISINRAFRRIIHLTLLATLIEHFGQLSQSVIDWNQLSSID